MASLQLLDAIAVRPTSCTTDDVAAALGIERSFAGRQLYQAWVDGLALREFTDGLKPIERWLLTDLGATELEIGERMHQAMREAA